MASEAPINCSIVVESKSSVVVDVCEQILSRLEEHNFDEDDIFAVHLTLEEAFLNAVKHGNKMDPTKKIKVDYAIDSNKVEISITDEGSGFERSGGRSAIRGRALRTGGQGNAPYEFVHGHSKIQRARQQRIYGQI